LHVAEAVLVRHQVDVPLAAIGVERLDVLRREGAGVLPHLLVTNVREGVLHIELQLVDFQ
jgi:hypothetical protein